MRDGYTSISPFISQLLSCVDSVHIDPAFSYVHMYFHYIDTEGHAFCGSFIPSDSYDFSVYVPTGRPEESNLMETSFIAFGVPKSLILCMSGCGSLFLNPESKFLY